MGNYVHRIKFTSPGASGLTCPSLYQELMIQQLEDEIRHLREQQRGSTAVDPATLVQPLTQTTSLGGVLTKDRNMLVAQLQDKLRQAAKFISQLAREKQQLIEVGNRLRAELLRNGEKWWNCLLKCPWSIDASKNWITPSAQWKSIQNHW